MIELLNRRAGRWLISLLAWPVLTITMAVQEHLSRTAMGHSFSWFDDLRFGIVEYLFWALLWPLVFDFSKKYPLVRPHRTRNLGLLAALSCAVVIVHALYRAPLHDFVYPLWIYPESAHVAVSKFEFYIAGNIGGDIWMLATIVAVAHLAFYYEQGRQRARELEQAQLHVLRAQLQPHFFFNTLNSISTLMHEDVNAADDMMANLAALLRRSMRDEKEYEIPLREELEILELYLAIERIRFADRLQIRIAVDPGCADALVPTLLLQPLVENALRHGIARRPGPGYVEINGASKDGQLRISIADDGAGLSDAYAQGVGLSNTRARLQHHYQNQYTFELTGRAGGGAVASIAVPYRRAAKDQ